MWYFGMGREIAGSVAEVHRSLILLIAREFSYNNRATWLWTS